MTLTIPDLRTTGNALLEMLTSVIMANPTNPKNDIESMSLTDRINMFSRMPYYLDNNMFADMLSQSGIGMHMNPRYNPFDFPLTGWSNDVSNSSSRTGIMSPQSITGRYNFDERIYDELTGNDPIRARELTGNDPIRTRELTDNDYIRGIEITGNDPIRARELIDSQQNSNQAEHREPANGSVNRSEINSSIDEIHLTHITSMPSFGTGTYQIQAGSWLGLNYGTNYINHPIGIRADLPAHMVILGPWLDYESFHSPVDIINHQSPRIVPGVTLEDVD
jgi:hypothetical protein